MGSGPKRVTTVMRLSREEGQCLRREEEALRSVQQGDRAQGRFGGRLETGVSGETESESQRV